MEPKIELHLSLSDATSGVTPPEGVIELRVWSLGGTHYRTLTRVVAGHADAYEHAADIARSLNLRLDESRTGIRSPIVWQ